LLVFFDNVTAKQKPSQLQADELFQYSNLLEP